jgi:hypothetical protein
MAIQFRGLSSIIREQLKTMPNLDHKHPLITEEAMMIGQASQYYTDSRVDQDTGTFMWGYSIWGVDQITGVTSEDA